MTDDNAEANDTEPAKADVAPSAEQLIIRLTFWQTILSVVGILIAIFALYAALTESIAVRQQTAAAVWPFVQLKIENYDTGDAAGFSLAFTNAGVGPARMQDVRLSLNGNVVRNWSELVAGVGSAAGTASSRNFISDRVLRPDETVMVFSTDDAVLARNLIDAVSSSRSALTFCYCSIFDECWLADSREDLQAPEPVASCPDFGDETYRN